MKTLIQPTILSLVLASLIGCGGGGGGDAAAPVDAGSTYTEIPTDGGTDFNQGTIDIFTDKENFPTALVNLSTITVNNTLLIYGKTTVDTATLVVKNGAGATIYTNTNMVGDSISLETITIRNLPANTYTITFNGVFNGTTIAEREYSVTVTGDATIVNGIAVIDQIILPAERLTFGNLPQELQSDLDNYRLKVGYFTFREIGSSTAYSIKGVLLDDDGGFIMPSNLNLVEGTYNVSSNDATKPASGNLDGNQFVVANRSYYMTHNDVSVVSYDTISNTGYNVAINLSDTITGNYSIDCWAAFNSSCNVSLDTSTAGTYGTSVVYTDSVGTQFTEYASVQRVANDQPIANLDSVDFAGEFPALTGTATADATITYQILSIANPGMGAVDTGVSVADGTGRFTITPSVALTESQYGVNIQTVTAPGGGYTEAEGLLMIYKM